MAEIIDRQTIGELLNKSSTDELISYIEEAFVSYSSKTAVVPPVGMLSFQSPPGDVHIKYGYIQDEPYYVIKIASGFYENPGLGLSSSQGLNLVFSQKTGVLETILMDEGYLTDVRTAVAGAICAKYLAPDTVNAIGIIGSGIQARLQLKYLHNVVDCKKVLVWGRSKDRLLSYSEEMSREGFEIETTTESRKIAQECNLIVTATPSKSPIIFADDLPKGVHITALGADTVGKQELHPEILKKADLIVLDSTKQCQSHGEIHKAYNDNLLVDKDTMELGEIISSGGIRRNPDDITIADLTGVATQDIQISKFILEIL
ncbi:MAG: ornithine cyclodeaminase [Bacteroides sp. SM23_62]|nr:MAG: ornithine cyclodeaminase [Bacteroides sp. SM23_62]